MKKKSNIFRKIASNIFCFNWNFITFQREFWWIQEINGVFLQASCISTVLNSISSIIIFHCMSTHIENRNLKLVNKDLGDSESNYKGGSSVMQHN